LQYDVATHPLLVKQAQRPVLEALRAALSSHRLALSLDAENPDTLFNTAQVLTSSGEEAAKDPHISDQEALKFLDEALGLLSRCLEIQELEYSELRARQQAADAVEAAQIPAEAEQMDIGMEPPLVSSRDEDSSAETEEQWATVTEPVTPSTILDTLEAQLSTLTTLCSILVSSPSSEPSPSKYLEWINAYSKPLLTVKLPLYLTLSQALDLSGASSLYLTRAIFLSSVLDLSYCLSTVSATAYQAELNGAFSVPELSPPTGESLAAHAHALITFSSTLSSSSSFSSPLTPEPARQWSALSSAHSKLGSAFKLADPPSNPANLHSLRAQASMLQLSLARPPVSYPPAVSNSSPLLRNAEVFYRNASRLATDEDEKDEALAHEAVAVGLRDPKDAAEKLKPVAERRGREWVLGVVEEMVDDRLVRPEDVDWLGGDVSVS